MERLGYHIALIFLALPDSEIALARVAARVAGGGHNIPEPTIRRRFKAGIENFNSLYKSLADSWALYDNSGEQPILVEKDQRNAKD